MKRSKMLEYMEFIISDYLGKKIHHPDVLADLLLREIEEFGMLPPKRADESPNGYGAAYLDDFDVAKNVFKFKHSWEPEDEKK